ncbi:MAG: VTT domain-containing protein [Halolamina sp.]
MNAIEASHAWSRAMPLYWHGLGGTAEALHAWFHTTPLYWHGVGVLGVIALYTFLTAVVLPLPSELIFTLPVDFGAPWYVELGATVLAGALGSAAGATVALTLGRRVAESSCVGRIRGRLPLGRLRSPGRVVGSRLERLVRDRGVVGLVVALAVPLMPDTLSTYAFTVLEGDARRYAAAAFTGNTLRLCVVAGAVGSVLAAAGL